MERVILTYGTFDMFHIGHLNLLRRLRAMGDKLIVGVSTDEFNALKGKKTIVPFEHRAAIVQALDCVDGTIAESSWDQKRRDIVDRGVTTLGMGDDWVGRFDELRNLCEVVYLPRTASVSSTHLKKVLNVLDQAHVRELKEALDLISAVVTRFE